MTAAEQYAANVDAVNAQRARLHGEQLPRTTAGGVRRRDATTMTLIAASMPT